MIEQLLSGKSVRSILMESEDIDVNESVNPEDLRVALFLRSVNDLRKAFIDVYSAYEELESAYPEFPDIFAEEYPFDKSFDEYSLKIADWYDSLKSKLL